MKRLIAISLLASALSCFGIDITNIPLGGFSITDTLLGVTNANYTARATVQQIAEAATNGWAWTNLTVAHAGAVTNGYPWTNVPVAAASTVPISGVTTPGAILTNGNDFEISLSNRIAIYTNRALAFYLGTNPPTGAGLSNTFQVDAANLDRALEVATNGFVSVGNGIRGPSGSVTVPTFSFGPNTNTGIYQSSGGVISLTHAGTRSFAFASTGMSSRGSGIGTFVGSDGFYGFNSTGTDPNSAANAWLRPDSAGTIRVDTNLVLRGTVTATNGVVQMVKPSFTTNFTCTTNLQTYLLNGTAPQVVTLPNAANVPNVIYHFSATNDVTSYIITNATGTQTIADGSSLSYTNSGSGKGVVSLMSDGAHWWLMAKGKTRFPCAQFSTQTNTTFANITNNVTLQTQDFNNNLGIGLDNSAWFTAGVGSRIYCTNLGTYMLTISAVWSKTSATAENGDIWLRQSGIDVPNSMTLISIANSSTNVMTVNFLMPVVTNNTFFDFQAASTAGAGQLQAMPAITSPFNRPACPSVIVTVNKFSD